MIQGRSKLFSLKEKMTLVCFCSCTCTLSWTRVDPAGQLWGPEGLAPSPWKGFRSGCFQYSFFFFV